MIQALLRFKRGINRCGSTTAHGQSFLPRLETRFIEPNLVVTRRKPQCRWRASHIFVVHSNFCSIRRGLNLDCRECSLQTVFGLRRWRDSRRLTRRGTRLLFTRSLSWKLGRIEWNIPIDVSGDLCSLWDCSATICFSRRFSSSSCRSRRGGNCAPNRRAHPAC